MKAPLKHEVECRVTSCSAPGGMLIPERRADERGGRGGVTPRVMPPPHCLPTKRAAFATKNDRLLSSWRCLGEKRQSESENESLGTWSGSLADPTIQDGRHSRLDPNSAITHPV